MGNKGKKIKSSQQGTAERLYELLRANSQLEQQLADGHDNSQSTSPFRSSQRELFVQTRDVSPSRDPEQAPLQSSLSHHNQYDTDVLSQSDSEDSDKEADNSNGDNQSQQDLDSDEEENPLSENSDSDSSSEEKEEEVESTSTRFTNLIRKVITLNHYPEDPIVTKKPELRSNQSLPQPEIYRLPPSTYVIDKVEQMRAELELASAKSYDKKLFFRPPASLDRVAETGDKVKNVGKPGKPKIRLVREIPPTPQAFYDILSDKRTQAAVPKSKVLFSPPEARAQELSMQWALKAANYHYHLTHLLQTTQNSAEEQVSGLSAWLSTTTSEIPADVKTTIKQLQSDMLTSKTASSECKPLLQSMVDTLLIRQEHV